MSAHLDRLVALHEAQLADLDEHRAQVCGGMKNFSRAPQRSEDAPQLAQPAQLRVHDLPRDTVRGLAGVLGVRQHGRDLEELRDAVAGALRAPAVDDDGRMAA